MRVLAHIHTLNAADVIEQGVAALGRQTRRPDSIIIVDNGSTDGTLDRAFPEQVAIIRNPKDLGVCGSIRTGMVYALEHGFDWIWILDADSAPEPDALENLLELYASWPRDIQDETAFIACDYHNVEDGVARPGCSFSRHGVSSSERMPDVRHYACHYTIWSGCLFRLTAVREIGLPNPDYVMDWGEAEYGYRVMKAGYKGYVDQAAVLKHNIRGMSYRPERFKLGPLTVWLYEYPPKRCYYSCRNRFYFALYECGERRFWYILGALMVVGNWMINFVVRPRTHGKHILACCRGTWHGITGNIAARY
jgi:GT2 family glycosyltransferase